MIKLPSILKRARERIKRIWRWRSAVTGRFVTREYAEAHPDETVRERG